MIFFFVKKNTYGKMRLCAMHEIEVISIVLYIMVKYNNCSQFIIHNTFNRYIMSIMWLFIDFRVGTSSKFFLEKLRLITLINANSSWIKKYNYIYISLAAFFLCTLQGLLYHRTCKHDLLCSWPSLNSYLK